MTIPSLTPIIDAVRDVRERYAPDAAAWAADILAGDARALAVGRELFDATLQLARDLTALVDDDTDVDFHVEELIGVAPVVDAVLVAIGEAESDDPEVNEQFRAVRLERQSGWLQRSIDGFVDIARQRELTDDEANLLGWTRDELAALTAGSAS